MSESSPPLTHVVAITAVSLMRADGEFTGAEVSVAAKILLTNFGSPGETYEDAVKWIYEVNEELEKIDDPTEYGNFVAYAAFSVKEQTSHEQRVTLYVQLDMIAQSDGYDEREKIALSLIREVWELEDDVTAVWAAAKNFPSAKKTSSGCALFLLPLVGMLSLTV